MRNNIKTLGYILMTLAFYLVLMSASGCVLGPPDREFLSGDPVDTFGFDKTTYYSEYQAHATVELSPGQTSEVTIDYGNLADVGEAPLTPSEVAQLAYWVRVAAIEFLIEESGGIIDEELESTIKRIHETLQHTHHLVTKDFDQFYLHQNYRQDPVVTHEDKPNWVAFVRNFQWYDIPEGAVFSVIYRSAVWLNVDTVTHELMHVVSFAITDGSIDASHNNGILWDEGGSRTIQARTKELYQINKL